MSVPPVTTSAIRLARRVGIPPVKLGYRERNGPIQWEPVADPEGLGTWRPLVRKSGRLAHYWLDTSS